MLDGPQTFPHLYPHLYPRDSKTIPVRFWGKENVSQGFSKQPSYPSVKGYKQTV